jgi:Ca-activated chloride channel homolog
MTRIIVLLVMFVSAACGKTEHRAAREQYNSGIELLAKGDHEAAETALLEARSLAGVDPELRFRAAYNLGLAYAAHAEKVKTGENADLAKALELTQQAVSWFSDAARLRKDDSDTLANLAIVRARAQAIGDELRKGEGKLEARLDAVINDQRGVLDDARGAWLAIKQAGGTDPLAQQGTLTHLADKERGIVAEAGVIEDLAGEEIDAIGKKPEDQRTDEEKVRVIQLKNLDLYLAEGRNRIADARRKLQELAAEDAVTRAETAMVALKRAREQLLDPITVLREVASEQLVLMQQTYGVAEAPADQIPGWLTGPALAGRQSGLRERVEEVRVRLSSATDNPLPPDGKPEQKQMIEQVKIALPLVTEASAAMDRAHYRLVDNSFKDAGSAEREALVALAKAIEQFADLKQTIDITSETQKHLVSLLAPDAAKQLPVAERARETKDALAQNLARMTRIKELIADEVMKLDAEAAAAPHAGSAAPPAAGSAAPPVDDKKQQIEAQKQMLAQAETLRGEAEKLIGKLDGAIKANQDPLTAAKAADAKLDELRRLFFSVIEHLQDLIRQQGETRDQTSAAHMETDDVRAPKLPGIASRQDQHGQLAKAITDALATQADAAAKAQDPQQQQQGKAMAAAADEVRLAQNDMGDAKRVLDKAVAETNQSHSLEPVTKSQASALEHLMNALKLLQPPQDQKQDQQKQDKDKQKQEQEQPPKEQPQGGAAQRARDEDARRQKERRDKQSGSDTVEKDW